MTNEIRFFFGAHMSARDALETRDAIDWCTVYCPEAVGYMETNQKVYQCISAGALDAVEVCFSLHNAPSLFKLFNMILVQGTHKRIELIDVPSTLSSFRGLDNAAQRVTGVAHRDCSYAELLCLVHEDFTAFVAYNRIREDHIVSELVRLNRALSNERILVRLGTLHYRVAALAEKAGLTVIRTLQKRRFGPLSLCYHYLNCGTELPDGLLDRFILAGMLVRHTWLAQTVSDPLEQEQVLHRTISAFTPHDIEELWEDCRLNPSHAPSILLQAIRIRNLA